MRALLYLLKGHRGLAQAALPLLVSLRSLLDASSLEELVAGRPAWQTDRRSERSRQAQLSYWRRQLAGPLPVLRWPCARPRLAARTSRVAAWCSMVPAELGRSVEALGHRNRTTPFMTYLA